MNEPLVLVRDEGPVRWLTLNRPDKKNALNGELVAALHAALTEPCGARCLALTGAGDTFSAGADLAALQAMQTASREDNRADSLRLADLFLTIANHPLPVIAAVNGHAFGGGAGLALACDTAIAAHGALFGFTEVRVGFVPAIVLNFVLRAVGEKIARDLCLTGRRVTVEEAQDLGLLHAVPADEVAHTVQDLGTAYAKASPEAIARTKRLFVELRHLPLADGLRRGAEANADARVSDDCREGVAAFLEKRQPRWNP